MFDNQRQLSQKEAFTHNLKKHQIFRMEIREKNVENIKKNLRKKYLTFKDPNDYQLLKNIDLNACINNFMKQNESDKVIDNFFLYASSKQSDHLFELLDTKVLQKLVDCLIEDECKQQLQYNRKILWILTNYTAYTTYGVPQSYLDQLLKLAKSYNIADSQKTINTYLLQTIALSVNNLTCQSQGCQQFLKNNKQLLLMIIQSYICTLPKLLKQTIQDNQYPTLLVHYCYLLDNIDNILLTFQQTIGPETYIKLIQCQIQTLKIRLDLHISIKQSNHDNVQLKILRSLRILVSDYEIDNQESFNKIKYLFLDISAAFNKFLKSYVRNAYNDLIIVGFIEWLNVVYSKDIPEQHSQQYTDFYCQLLEESVLSIIRHIFKTNCLPFHHNALLLCQNILLEEQLCEIVLCDSDFYVLPQILKLTLHEHSFRIRKPAIICVINLIKCTVYDRSDNVRLTLEVVELSKFVQLLAETLWDYADIELNLEIVQALSIIVQYAKKTGNKIVILDFIKDKEHNTTKLNKIIQECSSQQLKLNVVSLMNLIDGFFTDDQ